MTTITIPLSEEQVRKLEELTTEANLPPDELLRVRVEQWLNRPKGDFARAADYVVRKNEELYRRLA